MKLLSAMSSDLKAPAIILANVSAPMQQANDQQAAAQDTTGLLICIAHAAAEAGANAPDFILQITEQILAHGEGHGFGSMVTLTHQVPGPLCDIFMCLHH